MQGKRKLHEETEAIWHRCFLRLLPRNQEHIEGRILSEIRVIQYSSSLCF